MALEGSRTICITTFCFARLSWIISDRYDEVEDIDSGDDAGADVLVSLNTRTTRDVGVGSGIVVRHTSFDHSRSGRSCVSLRVRTAGKT